MKEIADNKNPEQTAMFVLNTKTTLFYPFKNAFNMPGLSFLLFILNLFYFTSHLHCVTLNFLLG
jgi:hypothetical protein